MRILVAAIDAATSTGEFPRALSSYPAVSPGGLLRALSDRARAEPFNLVATVIFFLAIAHTFMTPMIRRWAHLAEERHRIRPRNNRPMPLDDDGNEVPEVSFQGQILHFLSEVEAVFGIWAVVLGIAIALGKGWETAVDYVGHRVDFTEPMFVMVIMALASTRPLMRLAERCLFLFAAIGGATVGSWWVAILIVGPLFGSFITEPGAMTISALLLARQFYHLRPSARLSYATIGLLFVNVSVGGTLTHFAAPPMVMAAGPWHWGLVYMFTHFGWKAFTGIVCATSLYYAVFRREFEELNGAYLRQGRALTQGGGAYIPVWIIATQVAFLVFTVAVAPLPSPVHRWLPLLHGIRPGHGPLPEETRPEAASPCRLLPGRTRCARGPAKLVA
jgi:hypothetical protein